MATPTGDSPGLQNPELCAESILPKYEQGRGGLRLSRIRGYDRHAGRFPARITDQCRLAFSAGNAALLARGASLQDVVRVIFVVKDAGQLTSCAPFVSNALGANRPAATVMVVDSFDSPDVEIELELITHIAGTA
ncbi:Rid family hydrolase [Acetobacter oeni]|uniref:Enamine deaminase RidA n=1 Tax=Acetobacter oeni TaxID=304077 RepID=A0A511XLH2_9PROT|nr:Rid family hydrolase [Acetobacter oeni]MBB3883543.1 enamine deaminase RidA (YjgF/YER057c/UK114 family) [Acetobacter oeni]NHO19582.1 hypothetical protein [Acetobacter oeni]GBR03071.1 translation initiation inhibitor YjgF [Acetobacter oeni LMG 21952]GEN63764.1 hypothetical protein AOE01nite_19880 [Acetobacter oeni]